MVCPSLANPSLPLAAGQKVGSQRCVRAGHKLVLDRELGGDNVLGGPLLFHGDTAGLLVPASELVLRMCRAFVRPCE